MGESGDAVKRVWLVKLGFGGVQAFIGQARKVRDLAAGSQIIAELSRAIATRAKATVGAEDVILPYDPSGRFEVCPHQVVARVRSVDLLGVRTFAEETRKAALDVWATRSQVGQADLTRYGVALTESKEILENQRNTALELYWVAVPEEDYRASFREVSSLFDDRRHTRTFSQLENLPDAQHEGPPDAAPSRSAVCLQCGVRRSVANPSGSRTLRFDARRDHLCLVCLAKRLAEPAGREGRRSFPSTHRLAAHRLYQSKWFEQRRDELHSLASDEVEELLDRTERELTDLMARCPESDKQRYGRVYDLLWSDLQGRPGYSPYYAIICFDGDRMGQWFSGDFFSAEDLERKQKTLGRALAAFTETIAASCDRLGATLIYAGGDDALILAPLDTLLPLARAIRHAWDSIMRPVGEQLNADASDSMSLTCTLHASIVHMMEPLQVALADARRQLEQAKHVLRGGDRHRRHGRGGGFSLSVVIRAGASPTMVARWDELERLIASVEAFSNWRAGELNEQNFRGPTVDERRTRNEETIPTRVAYSIHEAAAPFFAPGSGALAMTEAFSLEVDRLMLRSKPTPSARGGSVELVKAWWLARAQPAEPGVPGLSVFRETVEVTMFLARALAWS